MVNVDSRLTEVGPLCESMDDINVLKHDRECAQALCKSRRLALTYIDCHRASLFVLALQHVVSPAVLKMPDSDILNLLIIPKGI